MNSCNNMCSNGRRQEQCCAPMQGRMNGEKTPCNVMHQMPCDMPSLAMSYVPMQRWENLYQPEEGFHNGTIFKDLNLPFTGRRVC